MNLFGSKAKWARTSNAPSLPTAGRSASSARLMWKLCMTGYPIPLLSGVAAGRPVSLEELRYFSPVGEEYRLKSASSNSLKTLRPISSSSRAEEGWLRHQKQCREATVDRRRRGGVGQKNDFLW